jgi:hypothetical protein
VSALTFEVRGRLTLADLAIIEALDETTRAAVERYAREGGAEGEDAAGAGASLVEAAYLQGYEDAVDEMTPPMVPRRLPPGAMDDIRSRQMRSDARRAP